MDDQRVENAVRQWLQSVVINLNLCPFARKALIRNSVRFTVSEVDREDHLLEVLLEELQLLQNSPNIETTLLIHPRVLSDFTEYNEFLPLVDEFLGQIKLDGIFQIASFHPEYQFAGSEPEDVENYTNRSPYPILHILKEESLDEAIDNYPDVDRIPEINIKRMREMGLDKMQELLRQCFG